LASPCLSSNQADGSPAQHAATTGAANPSVASTPSATENGEIDGGELAVGASIDQLGEGEGGSRTHGNGCWLREGIGERGRRVGGATNRRSQPSRNSINEHVYCM
jgi:hypothetical protein